MKYTIHYINSNNDNVIKDWEAYRYSINGGSLILIDKDDHLIKAWGPRGWFSIEELD